MIRRRQSVPPGGVNRPCSQSLSVAEDCYFVRKPEAPKALPAPALPEGARILITLYADGRHITEYLPADTYVISIADFLELLARANPREVINAASNALNRLPI